LIFEQGDEVAIGHFGLFWLAIRELEARSQRAGNWVLSEPSEVGFEKAGLLFAVGHRALAGVGCRNAIIYAL
jgi:hypothetical protein